VLISTQPIAEPESPANLGRNINLPEIFSMTLGQIIEQYGSPFDTFAFTGGQFVSFRGFFVVVGDAGTLGGFALSNIVNYFAGNPISLIVITDSQYTINNSAWNLGIGRLSEVFANITYRQRVDDMIHNEHYASGGYIVNIEHGNISITFEFADENADVNRAWIFRPRQ